MRLQAPPPFFRWLIRRVTPPSAEGLLGDLTEEFVMRSRRDGPGSARTWYRWEVVHSIPALMRLRALEDGRHLVMTLCGGIVGYLAALAGLYALFSALSARGDAPLGGLSAPVFLSGWVFAGSALGTVLGAWVVPQSQPTAGPIRVAAVGLTASLLLLTGIDKSMTLPAQVLVASIAVGGAIAGETLLRFGRHLPNSH